MAASFPPQEREGKVRPPSMSPLQPPQQSDFREKHSTSSRCWSCLHQTTPLPCTQQGHIYQSRSDYEPVQWVSPSEDQNRTPACAKSTDHRLLQNISFSFGGNRTRNSFFSFFSLESDLWFFVHLFIFLFSFLVF